MKAELKFDLDDFDDKMAHKRAVSADSVYLCVFDIANKIFRPNRKHGYPDKELEKLIEGSEEAQDAISQLEDMFYAILAEHEVNLNDI